MQPLFLLPLFLILYTWNSASLWAGRGLQALVSAHLLVVSFHPHPVQAHRGAVPDHPAPAAHRPVRVSRSLQAGGHLALPGDGRRHRRRAGGDPPLPRESSSPGSGCWSGASPGASARAAASTCPLIQAPARSAATPSSILAPSCQGLMHRHARFAATVSLRQARGSGSS